MWGSMHRKHQHILDADMAGTGALLRVKTGESVFHQTVARQEDRCEGCRVDSHLFIEASG